MKQCIYPVYITLIDVLGAPILLPRSNDGGPISGTFYASYFMHHMIPSTLAGLPHVEPQRLVRESVFSGAAVLTEF